MDLMTMRYRSNRSGRRARVQLEALEARALLSTIVDDSGAGFSAGAGWTAYSRQGYLNRIPYTGGSSGATASGTFSGRTPGRYRVSATWDAEPNRATNSPYTVLDGNTTLATVAVNQQQVPSDFTDAGVGWKDLGGPYTITGSA